MTKSSFFAKVSSVFDDDKLTIVSVGVLGVDLDGIVYNRLIFAHSLVAGNVLEIDAETGVTFGFT